MVKVHSMSKPGSSASAGGGKAADLPSAASGPPPPAQQTLTIAEAQKAMKKLNEKLARVSALIFSIEWQRM